MSWFIVIAATLIVGYAFYEGRRIFTDRSEKKVIPKHEKTKIVPVAKRWRLWRK